MKSEKMGIIFPTKVGEVMREKIKDIKFKFKQVEIKSIRIKIVKLVSLLLITTLIIRATYIHHTYSSDYIAYMKKVENKSIVKKSQTRGSIYDRNGKKLVTNTPVDSIIYRYNAEATVDELYQLAFKLASIIQVDHANKLGNSNLMDLYVQLWPSTKRVDITEEDLLTLTDEHLSAQVIYNKMTEAYYGGENTLKFDASVEEVAKVAEQIDEATGVAVIRQAKRHHPDDLGHYDIVGRVSKGDSSFLSANFNRYLEAGYTINDQIGLSSIEQQYEHFLRGHKQHYEVNDNGEHIELSTGIRGADLTLTIDTELSDRIDHILEKHMRAAKNNRPAAKYLREGYVVVVDPTTGEILSLNGKVLQDDQVFVDHSLGTMHNAFTMGSVVKGATLLIGYQHQVTHFGDTIEDKPMIFADGSKKASWAPLGFVNDIDALRVSSNVYFMQQAIRMGGDVYYPKTNLNIDLNTLIDHRTSFAEYGLGAYTGIDLPGEQIGLRNQDVSVAKLLDFVIGQADTYTTLQLAQYIATVANGGNRYALRLLKEASIPIDEDARQVIYTSVPHLLNQIDLSPEAFERVREGFRQVLQSFGGTGYAIFKDSNYSPAGKTGTAEEFARDSDGYFMYDWQGELIEANNITFVGYAPHYKPQIAIAVVFPQAELPKEKNPIALEVANDIFNAYFELQQQRNR